MSEALPTPTPPVVPEPKPLPVYPGFLKSLGSRISNRWIEYIILAIVGAILAKIGIVLPKPDLPDDVIFHGQDVANRPIEIRSVDSDTQHYFGGWLVAPTVRDQVQAGLQYQWFSDTDAGKIALGDDDYFLWKAAEKIGVKLDARNQGSVGSCVSFGTGAAVDLCQIIQISTGANKVYHPTVQEAIYGLGRVEIGKGRIRGDGLVGSWAAKAVQEYGVLARIKTEKYDLTTYSEQRCREWGNRGLPDDLEPTAKLSPVRSFTFCRSTSEVDRALSQGYPIAICSQLGVSQQRDADGFAKYDRSWAHCMAIIGKRTDIPGYYVWNSWGPKYHRGPIGIGQPPEGGFWLRKSDLEKVLSQRDTEAIAFSDAVGFPARKIDWIVQKPVLKFPADEIVFNPFSK